MRSNEKTYRNALASLPASNYVAAMIAFASLLIGGSVAAQSAQTQPQPTLQAAAPSGSGYLLVLGRTLDRPKLIRYSMTLPPIYAASGGRYIATGRPGAGIRCIAGLCEGRSAVVAYWENSKSVSEFWWGTAYRQAVPLRDAAGVFTVVGLQGYAATQGDAQPFASGALLVALTSGDSLQTGVVNWIAAARSAGARSLIPYERNAVSPLEGDALFDRVLLLSFASAASRDGFIEGTATKDLLRASHASGPTSLIALVSIDAPLPPAAPPAGAAPKP